MTDLTVDVPEALRPYVDAALARLGYLYPALGWAFDAGNGRITVAGPGEAGTDALRKEIFFQLYREKIHQDTLAIRTRIYEATAL